MPTMWPWQLAGTVQVFPSLHLLVFVLNWGFIFSHRFVSRGSFVFSEPPTNTPTADTGYLFRQAAWIPTTPSHCWISWIKPSVALDTASSTLSSAGKFLSYCLWIAAMETTIPSKSILRMHFPPQSKDQKDTQFGIWAEIQITNFKRSPRHKLI